MAADQHVEAENSNKKIGKSVLDHFSQISNDNEAKRVKSASLLLQYLYKSNSDKNYDEVQYALKRIIRGLGGSKNSSRVGFYSTLVALLHTFPEIALDDVLECVRKHLQLEGGNSKSEIGDIYTGRVLACGALIRSRKIFSGDHGQQEAVLRLLINAGQSRSYLSIALVKFISELLLMCNEGQVKHLWPVLNSEVLKPWPEQSLDSLYLLLLIRKTFPGFLKASLLSKALTSDEVLCDKNLEAICNVAMNISTISSLKHPLYPLLGEAIATSNVDLPFVSELDQQLARYNRNKLMAASLLVRDTIPHVQDTVKIPQFLTENFVRQILHHYRTNRTNNKNDDEFHEEITKFFDDLCKRLQGDAVEAKTKINVLKRIIFYPGSFVFESVTKSKNVQKIVRTLDKEGVKKLSAVYRDVLTMKKEKTVAPNVAEQWLNSERIYAAQLLTKLLGFPLVQSEAQWKIKNLKLFMDMGFFNNKYANVGHELASNVKDVFFRALDLKFNKLEDVALVLIELIEYLKSMLVAHGDSLRSPLTEEELQIFNQMHAISTKLDGKKDKDECALVFEVLFLHMGLQLFQDKDLAVSSLNELFLCYERVSKKRKQVVDEDNPEWIEVVVDLFLNVLSHNSLLLRNVVGSVFPYLCKYLTPSSIHQILSVLDPKNESNPLSDSESDDDDSAEEEFEDDDDNETVNDKLRMAVQAALGNNGYQTDEESVDLDDMDENDAEKLDKALAGAFRQFKPNRGKSKKQSKQEESLTHFRIRALDLLEIYLDSEPEMLSCLEIMLPLLQMLEFSIRDEHQKQLLMRVRHCLRKLSNVKKFKSTEGITDSTLGDLLNNLLEKGTKNSMLLQDMSNEISECCAFIIKCTEVGPLPGKMKKRCQDKVIEILTNAINVYFTQRDCLIPYYLFKSIFQLHWEGNLVFAPMLFAFVFNADIRPFRRNQALELLKIFYSNRRADEAYGKFLSTVAKHENKLCGDVVAMLDEFCQRPKSKQIKEKFIGNLFNLLRAMLSSPRTNDKVDWKMLGDKIREFRSHVPLSRDAKMTYNQLCRTLKIPHAVKMKAEVVKFSVKDDSDEEHAAKKQKMSETKKQRKEAKARRVENMSAGLSEYSFDNLSEEREEVNGIDESPEPEDHASKKLHKRRKSEVHKVARKNETNLNKSAYV